MTATNSATILPVREDPLPVDLSVLALPTYLQRSYKRIVLSGGADTAVEAMAGQSSTLLVTGSWEEWRRASLRHSHCVHFEWALADGPDLAAPEEDVYLRYTDWMFAGGADMTRFGGISLGALFWRDVTLACLERDRLITGITRLIRAFKPEEIVIAADAGPGVHLDGAARVALADAVARRHDVEVTSRVAAETTLSRVSAADPWGRRLLRQLYAMIVERLFDLRWRSSGRKPKVFFLLNGAALLPLIASSAARGIAPVIAAAQWPKTLSFLRQCWRQGVVLAAFPEARLSEREREELKAMSGAVERGWGPTDDIAEETRRGFIRQRCLATSALERAAAKAKRYRRLFERHRPVRVVVGDSTNQECRAVLENARALDIPADEVLNGMFLSARRCDARSGRDQMPGLIDRLLVWGSAALPWAAAAAPDVETELVGYPPAVCSTAVPSLRGQGRRRWLVLPCYVDGDDVRGLQASFFAYIIAVLRMLRELGYSDVRLKLHPGVLPGWPMKEDVERILMLHDVAAPVYQADSLAVHLTWADAVIGPVNSGAWVETLAADRAYFPLLPAPSSMDMRFLGGIRVFNSVGALRRAIADSWQPDVKATLQALCAATEIEDPVSSLWKAVERRIDPQVRPVPLA